jgi:hypothetical protein
VSDNIVAIESTAGMINANLLKSLLEAQGIEVWLSHESASTAVGLGVGPTAEVQIMVREDQAQLAREIVQDFRAGKYSDEA